MLATSPWKSKELLKLRTKLGSLDLPLLLVYRVSFPKLDQPNHLFLWACSQATKYSWRKLALKQIYHFQTQLDCRCCSAILLLTHDWYPLLFPTTAVPIFYPSFSELILPSPLMHAFINHLLNTYCMYSKHIFTGLWKIKVVTNSLKLLSSKKWGLFPFSLNLVWPSDLQQKECHTTFKQGVRSLCSLLSPPWNQLL